MEIPTDNIPDIWQDLYNDDCIVKYRVYEKYKQLDDDALQQKIVEKYSKIRENLGHEGYHYGGGLYYKMVLEDLSFHIAGLQVVVFIATQRELPIKLIPEGWVLRFENDFSTCDDHEFCSREEKELAPGHTRY